MGDNPSNNFARPATLDDLIRICRAFNESGVRYLLIGGWSIILLGNTSRATQDIDFLVDTSPQNVAKIREALTILPDLAALEIDDTDLEVNGTVRVVDEIVIDLMDRIYDVSYQNAGKTLIGLNGTEVYLADVQTLMKIKGPSLRTKDQQDMAFLVRLT